MAKVYTEIKEQLKKSQKTMKDLALAIDIKYMRLSNYINGFVDMPQDVERQIEDQLTLWALHSLPLRSNGTDA